VLRRLAALALLATVAACQAGPQAPLLTDGREVVTRAMTATSALRTVHARIDYAAWNPDQDRAGRAPDMSAFAEVDVDLAVPGVQGIAGVADGGRQSFILVGGAAFLMNSETGRWSRSPMGGMDGIRPLLPGGAALADVPAILAGALADPTTTQELQGVVDCATGRCYHVLVSVSPDRVLTAVIDLVDLDQQPGFDEHELRRSGFVPALAVDIAVDTASHRLVDASVSLSLQGYPVTVRMQLSRFDEQVSIQPPPPALVDQFGQGPVPGGRAQTAPSQPSAP